jgi:MFS family permease
MSALIGALILAGSFDGVGLVLGGWTDLNRIAFVEALVVSQLPAGMLLDGFGVRRVGAGAAALWVLATLLLVAGNPTATLVASVGVGIASAAFLPLAAKATATWFPRSERTRATSIFVAAASLPIVVTLSPFVPKLSGATLSLGEAAFTAVLAVAFLILYREPDDPRVTYAERTYITDGGAQPVAVPALGPTFAVLARSRKLWALAFGFGAFSYAFGLGAVQVWGVAQSWVAILMILWTGIMGNTRTRGGPNDEIYKLALYMLAGLLWIAVWRSTGTVSFVCAFMLLLLYAIALTLIWTIPGRIAPRGATGTVAAIMALAGAIGAFAVWWTADDPLGASIAAVIASVTFAFALGRIEPIADPV